VYFVAGATLAFAYADLVIEGRLIAVIHAALPDTGNPTEKPNISTAKPQKAKRLTVCLKIVVDIEKNPVPQKIWMMQLRTPLFLG
jgi:hypothetical protein